MGQLGRVMFESVRFSESPYSLAQRQAWVPSVRSAEVMKERLEGQFVFLSIFDSGNHAQECRQFRYSKFDPNYIADESPVVGGFVSLCPKGYVDMAFIRPEFQGGVGLFRRMMAALLEKARVAGISELSTHASLSARDPFAALGFQAVCKETVPIGKQRLERFVMRRELS